MSNIKKQLITVIMPLFVVLELFGQSPNFRMVPEVPKEQDTVQIIYDARTTVLNNADKITAKLTGFQDFKWTSDVLEMSKKDSVWTTTYILPPNLGLLNIVFESDTLVDNGGEATYSYMFVGNDDRQMSGGMLGWGLIRTPKIVRGVPFVVDPSSYKTDEILLMWIRYELKYHPENRFKVLYAAASALKHMNTDESIGKLNNELNTLQELPDLKEEHWAILLKVYEEVLQDTVKANEIKDLIVSIFPDGKFVNDQLRLSDYKKFSEEKDNNLRLELAKAFIDKHPYDVKNSIFDNANRISYSNVYWIISVFSSVNKDLETYTKYVSQAPSEAFGQIVYRSIDVPYRSQQTTTAQEILPYAQVVMQRIDELKGGDSSDDIANTYYYNAPLFAKILLENKLYDEAYIYATAAQSSLNFSRADLNDTYVRILEGQGEMDEAFAALEKSYRLNQSSSYMLDLLKAKYIANNRSEEGYDNYLLSLTDESKKQELIEKVRQKLIDKDVPDFELLDQNGKSIRLANLKGKVVVLDFWASWCAPCKAAFPGMKLAVEHFKDDPNVVFYFVDTQERKDMTDYVKNYMEENKYPFTVLLDHESKISKDFGVSAIPHKMVIGIDGKLRFSEVGYMGSASELKDEIVEMVNLAKE